MRWMVGRLFMFVFSALALLALPARADYHVPLMPAAPVIDGRIDATEWTVSAGFDGFVNCDTQQLQRRRVRAFVGATPDTIYLAIQSQLPDEGPLLASVVTDSTKVIHDDTAEIHVNPTPGAPGHVDYQFLINALDKVGYKVHLSHGARERVTWQGHWRHAVGQHDGWWHIECAIPIASMRTVAPGRRTTDGAWAINVTRNWRPDWQWSSLSGGYANSGERFVFTDTATPATHFTWSGDPALPPVDGTLSLRNPSDAPIALHATLRCERNNMPDLAATQPLTIPPRSNASLRVTIPENDPTTHYRLTAAVTSAAGLPLYLRSNAWTRARVPFRWVQGPPPDAPPLDLRIAYYPSRNRLRLLADITGLPPNAKPTSVTATLRAKVSGDVVAQLPFPLDAFVDGRQEQSVTLPPLEGDYEIALALIGTDVPTGAVLRAFTRTVFPWEHVSLGRSTAVFPPFTPLMLSDRTLRTVLRTHTLNDSGLLDQVMAQSANTGVNNPLLAAPMRYAVTVAGTAAPITAEPLRVVTNRPDTIVTAGRFRAGPLQATWTNTWDYDGTLRVDLTLDGSAGQAVDALTLEIPLRADAATHLHASSDRIHAPVMERLPATDGVAWDSRRITFDAFIRNFCPYVFLGNPVRGLCWFAENDRGWGWNPDTPNMEIERRGDTVLLRVHVINAPTVIATPRTLTFGLLAAPIKPPLTIADGGEHSWRHRYDRDRYSLLETDINWFALGDGGSVYPAGRDIRLWEMLARGNREALDDATIATFVNYGRRYFAPYGQAQIDRWDAHARHNLRAHLGHRLIFAYSRASCQLFDEFETFKDEWALDDLRTVEKGNGIGEITVVPSTSFIDYNLYWYAKSFEFGGNRGVYWHNYVIAPSFNTGMTDAYRRPDGTLVPAAGFWGLRELAKRTFVMMNERRMAPITVPHMSSFSPLPLLSFATVQGDWDWKHAAGDAQTRFPREYLTIVSAGELAGVWPVALHEHGAQAHDPWVQRTFTGVRLVHELNGFGLHATSDAHKQHLPLAQPVLDLLDRPGLEVYKYWEDRPQPVRATDDDIPTIVYSVPGAEAVVVVTSYADSDRDVTLRVDRAVLGFDPGWTASDVETGASLPPQGDNLVFALKRHDVRTLRLRPTP